MYAVRLFALAGAHTGACLPRQRARVGQGQRSYLRVGDAVTCHISSPTLNDASPLCVARAAAYSERVWLALELKGIAYDTVRIDNTGGGRPQYFTGSTPQIRWADGRTQGESLDIIRELDRAFPDSSPLWPPATVEKGAVDAMVSAWRRTFPRSARPSSRAAFLFDCAAQNQKNPRPAGPQGRYPCPVLARPAHPISKCPTGAARRRANMTLCRGSHAQSHLRLGGAPMLCDGGRVGSSCLRGSQAAPMLPECPLRVLNSHLQITCCTTHFAHALQTMVTRSRARRLKQPSRRQRSCSRSMARGLSCVARRSPRPTWHGHLSSSATQCVQFARGPPSRSPAPCSPARRMSCVRLRGRISGPADLRMSQRHTAAPT